MKPFRKGNRSGRSSVRRVFLGLERLEPRLPLTLDVPALSSLPGANHTIYLDFDGHVTQGTSWNNAYSVASINSPAYSTDADTANFSASELANIQNSWKRAAEDFAPFHVNVTTIEPPAADLVKSGTGDSRWGVRVVVTKDVAFNCGCGGIAYINSFNWNSDTPVFVFNSGLIGVAEAISHEAGHALGLSHDGTASSSYYSGHGSGATSWSAIMGVGYYVNVSQWDKGEFYGSNNAGSNANYNKGPDDLQVITTYNGFGYRTDDHSNTDAGSSPLAVNGESVSGSGIIERTTDVDVFQFTTGAGNVSLNINPANPGANLDIKADLYNSSGQLVASSNPTTALNASFNLTLAAGQYFLRLDGIGVGNPTVNPPTGYTDYGSLGQYSISGVLVAATGDVLNISATDASKVEGNSGSTPLTFTVTRTGDLSGATTVAWSVTGSGTAAADGTDFSSGAFPSGSLDFRVGEFSQTITVNVAGDTTPESNEGFSVSLSNASLGTTISGGSANSLIQNDDSPPASPVFGISATDANQAEGTGGKPTPFVLTITRSGDTSAEASVKYTVTGTSSRKASSSDFENGFAKNVLVSFSPGQSTAEITLNVIADAVKESNEKFKVTLSSPVNATLGTQSATGTILNDDSTAASRGQSELQFDDDDVDSSLLIAVADPLWMFIPSEMLTADQLSVPVITIINGVSFVGDLADELELDESTFDDGDLEFHGLVARAVDNSALAPDRLWNSFSTKNANVRELTPIKLSQPTPREQVASDTNGWTVLDDPLLDSATARESDLDRLHDQPGCADLTELDRWWSDWTGTGPWQPDQSVRI